MTTDPNARITVEVVTTDPVVIGCKTGMRYAGLVAGRQLNVFAADAVCPAFAVV